MSENQNSFNFLSSNNSKKRCQVLELMYMKKYNNMVYTQRKIDGDKKDQSTHTYENVSNMYVPLRKNFYVAMKYIKQSKTK
jgi:hypothetical protein